MAGGGVRPLSFVHTGRVSSPLLKGGMLNSEKGEGSNEAHIVTNTKKQGHKGKNKKNELAPRSEKNKDAIRCFFCKNKGHVRKNCPKREA
ncbi:Retrovirus-related Pol polyprotein from transposon TNT 1-94 [Senna tora]|uniref:Retrovirus-related Pol polyprotein from transposon TNT 1-94 n=1 Tax=Senna tora TaxID=362788 RepID=A0A834SEC9_9FABA|nr:Retrovirus-related Pol polyprotein from transposon TNT 1-94 [Senna tora]